MTPLKLQRRDDPLAVSRQDADPITAATASTGEAGGTNLPATPQAETPARPPRKRSTRRTDSPHNVQQHVGEGHTYDDDRLEQTGWRLYESLLERVRDRAEQLSAAGIPTSAAALAAATLHAHLPQSIEEGTELMRTYRQVSAGRARTRRDN